MAVDRHRGGMLVLRLCIGTFFLFEGIGKTRWFGDPSILASQLNGWLQAAPAQSFTHTYLTRVAIPGASIFARLVPFGEIVSGLAMIGGVWTPLFAFIAFAMAMNFHIGSGALFKYSFLTNGYGLPVLGSTLALVLAGGTRKAVKKVKLSAPGGRNR
jgi:uncharacterized membrane protein YphA (DoxX/SURF4 family)